MTAMEQGMELKHSLYDEAYIKHHKFTAVTHPEKKNICTPTGHVVRDGIWVSEKTEMKHPTGSL